MARSSAVSSSSSVGLLLLQLLTACGIPPRMCAAEGDCGGRAACVAGRCLANGATAVIDGARRLLFAPVDVAYVRRDQHNGDATMATLGGVLDRGAIVLLRFSASVPAEADVLEAYVVLERAIDFDVDPTPIALRPERVVSPWEGRSVSWLRQPRVEDIGAPLTRVSPAAGPLVRLDVRGLVQRWRRRTGDDFGLAVVAEGHSATGIAFTLAPAARERDEPIPASAGALPTQLTLSVGERGGSYAVPRSESAGPRLELYVK